MTLREFLFKSESVVDYMYISYSIIDWFIGLYCSKGVLRCLSISWSNSAFSDQLLVGLWEIKHVSVFVAMLNLNISHQVELKIWFPSRTHTITPICIIQV